MKSVIKKYKWHALVVIVLVLIMGSISFVTQKDVSQSKPKVTHAVKHKKAKSTSTSSSSSSSTSSNSQLSSTSEPASETSQPEASASVPQAEQAPTQEYVQPAQPDDSCYPNGFQSDYFVSPDDGSNATPSQDWHDDQVQWGIEQGYIDE